MQVRDELLANKEITREELKALVDEWVLNGGKIKQIKPHDAYSFAPPSAQPSMSSKGLPWKPGNLSARKSIKTWITNGPPKKTAKIKATKKAK
jgi:hypothetical protein